MGRCPAWGLWRIAGSRLNSAEEIIDSGERLKTIIDPDRQGLKTGSGYARLRVGLRAASDNLTHPEKRALARLSKDGAYGSRRRFAPPHHKGMRYSMGKLRGLVPSGKAWSIAASSSAPSMSSPAAALS